MNRKFKGEIEELETLGQQLNFSDIPNELKNNWEAAIKAFPENTPFFLEDSFIDETLKNSVSLVNLGICLNKRQR